MITCRTWPLLIREMYISRTNYVLLSAAWSVLCMYKYFSYLYIINYYLKYYLLPICSEPTYSSYFLLPPLDSYIAKQLKVCILMLMLYERMKSFEEKIVF